VTPLVEALQMLHLDGEIALGGHWITLRRDGHAVYVVEAAWGGGYYTWCDDPRERSVESYPDPVTAIRAGLRRATRAAQGGGPMQEGRAD
jgi:hypothetical protein